MEEDHWLAIRGPSLAQTRPAPIKERERRVEEKMSTAASPFHCSVSATPGGSRSTPSSPGLERMVMMEMVAASPLRQSHIFSGQAQPLTSSVPQPALIMDRQQRELFRRRIVSSGRPDNVASSRVLGTTGATSRNKQKRTLSQIIGRPGIGSGEADLDAFIRSTLRNGGREESPGFARSFPTAPERVLDAPGLVDDFYLNVLDWGKRNMMAVALGPSVYLWNGKTGAVSELMSLPNESSMITSLRWIHDGSSLAAGTSDGFVQIWDAELGKKIRTIVASQDGHRLASLAWNKHLLSTGSRVGAVCTNDVRLARPLILSHQSLHDGHEVCGLEWSPDGLQLASGGNDNIVHVWDNNNPTPRHVFTEHRSAVKALAWCPWRQGLLATGGGSQDKHIKTWNTMTGECVSSTNTDASVSSLVWSKTSRELVSAHGQPDNQIRVWKVSSNSHSSCTLVKSTGLENAHSGRILHMTLSPDGQTLVTAGADESIKFWKAFEPQSDKPDGISTGKKKPGHGDDGKDYVLMPKFSRSGAIDRALNAGNRMVI